MLGIRRILDFARNQFNARIQENTRESFRDESVKPLVIAGVLLHNPDDLDRPTNSPKNCYQVTEPALSLFKKFGSKVW